MFQQKNKITHLLQKIIINLILFKIIKNCSEHPNFSSLLVFARPLYLVLVGVIEHDHGSLGPGEVGAGHHQHGGGVGGDGEGEVRPQLRVQDPVVRRQVGGARQHGELRGKLT